MSEIETPRVSVGLPVHNGEDYLEEAIQSILSQDFAELELIISDNASDDRTPQICRKYANQDDRVVYVRRPYNIGGAHNFNFVLELARGEYFKWMAHDDVCRPRFLSACVELLDADPSAILAYPSPLDIDERGELLGRRDQGLRLDNPSAYERFRSTMAQGHAALPQFGVVRTAVLRRTSLLAPYNGSDRPLLAELALFGRLVEVPEELFLHREHQDRSVYAYGDEQGMRLWWNPLSRDRFTLMMWRRFGDYLRRVHRSPATPADRLRCYAYMVRWAVHLRSQLLGELAVPLRYVLARRLSRPGAQP